MLFQRQTKQRISSYFCNYLEQFGLSKIKPAHSAAANTADYSQGFSSASLSASVSKQEGF